MCNKIFQVYCDCDMIYMTRSESLAYRRGKEHGKVPIWIVETNVDTYPVEEIIYDTLRDFKRSKLC